VIIKALLEAGATVTAFDPEAQETAAAVLGNTVTYAVSSYAALDQADALIIATEWNEFKEPDFARISSLLKQPLIYDGRNIYDVDAMAELGFEYHSIGRRSSF
jgi:UDPglucose 6-dehydrogenase